jgi:hypothetical protein
MPNLLDPFRRAVESLIAEAEEAPAAAMADGQYAAAVSAKRIPPWWSTRCAAPVVVGRRNGH